MKKPTPPPQTTGWLGLTRAEFTAWYSQKYALNKPEKDSPGLATTWPKHQTPKEAA